MNSASRPHVFAWEPSCWLAARGGDAASFLQGQFTNELRHAVTAVYGLWLNVKGKVIADSFVVPQPAANAYRICSYESSASVIRERLASHVIADEVDLEDLTDTVAAVTLLGETAMATAHELHGEFGGDYFRGHRLRDEHVEYVFPRAAQAAVRARLVDLPVLSRAEVERMRIDSGTPAVPRDIGPTDLPNEGGLEVDAISFTKGCYLGQEVIARLKNLGQVRRKLLRVRGTMTNVPALPAPLYVAERAVGELRSAVIAEGQLHGLALLTIMHLQPGTSLALSPMGAPVLSASLPP